MTDELCERGWQFLFSLLSWLFSLLLKHCLANDFYETFIISKWASLRSGTIFMINHPARKSPTFIDCLVVRTLSLSLKTRNGRTWLLHRAVIENTVDSFLFGDFTSMWRIRKSWKKLGCGFKHFSYSTRFGKWSNSTAVFQMGWFNHQLYTHPFLINGDVPTSRGISVSVLGVLLPLLICVCSMKFSVREIHLGATVQTFVPKWLVYEKITSPAAKTSRELRLLRGDVLQDSNKVSETTTSFFQVLYRFFF